MKVNLFPCTKLLLNEVVFYACTVAVLNVYTSAELQLTFLNQIEAGPREMHQSAVFPKKLRAIWIIADIMCLKQQKWKHNGFGVTRYTGLCYIWVELGISYYFSALLKTVKVLV